MALTLVQMVLLMACGVGWRIMQPLGLKAEETRKVLTTVVYYLFLPALIIDVLWQAKIGWHSLQFTALGLSVILSAMFLMWLLGKLFRYENRRLGAVILATAYPNVTFMGLPVLEQTFGAWARSVVIQMDLFVTSPLLYTVGIVAAKHFGQDEGAGKTRFLTYLNAPPFWAAGFAVVLNLNHIPEPLWLSGTLKLLSGAVAPIMLFSIGLALSWTAVKFKNLPYITPVILIKLLLMPLFAWVIVQHLTIDTHQKQAAVMDIAMPSMLIGIVLCDRYRLDSSLYAMAVTITTALSLITLPLWYQFLRQGS